MKKRILICDDDLDILEVCRVILGKKNFEVFTSVDCESVFARLESIKPDVILMDLWIPVMGGEICTKKLREHEITSTTPVILFSANNEIEQISKKVNADGFIRKPFDIKDLIALIEKQLAKKVDA